MTDAPDGSRSRPSDSDAGGIQPRSLRTGSLWIGWVLFALLLMTPTLGSHGPNAGDYEGGEPFACLPALGPTTDFPSNIWEEWPDTWTEAPNSGVRAAQAARHNAESAFQVAVCAEQRSRRVAWALVVAIPTLAIALTGRRPATPAADGSSETAGQG